MSDIQVVAWLDNRVTTQDGAAPQSQTLEGALPGLAKAQLLTPLQRLQTLAGIRTC